MSVGPYRHVRDFPAFLRCARLFSLFCLLRLSFELHKPAHTSPSFCTLGAKVRCMAFQVDVNSDGRKIARLRAAS
jgi:hypothetical protein